jgi:hypothetical protein
MPPTCCTSEAADKPAVWSFTRDPLRRGWRFQEGVEGIRLNLGHRSLRTRPRPSTASSRDYCWSRQARRRQADAELPHVERERHEPTKAGCPGCGRVRRWRGSASTWARSTTTLPPPKRQPLKPHQSHRCPSQRGLPGNLWLAPPGNPGRRPFKGHAPDFDWSLLSPDQSQPAPPRAGIQRMWRTMSQLEADETVEAFEPAAAEVSADSAYDHLPPVTSELDRRKYRGGRPKTTLTNRKLPVRNGGKRARRKKRRSRRGKARSAARPAGSRTGLRRRPA